MCHKCKKIKPETEYKWLQNESRYSKICLECRKNISRKDSKILLPDGAMSPERCKEACAELLREVCRDMRVPFRGAADVRRTAAGLGMIGIPKKGKAR